MRLKIYAERKGDINPKGSGTIQSRMMKVRTVRTASIEPFTLSRSIAFSRLSSG